MERAVFAGKGRVFCIASAGDTALALAEEHEVVACDINPVQLEYARERGQGAPRRVGDADRAMAAMRRLMPQIGWSRGLLEEFLSMRDVEAQSEFWHRNLDTWRFRKGMELLMSRAVLRRVYSEPLLAALEPEFGKVLCQRMERTFSRHPNAENPYARALLLGEAEEQAIDMARGGSVTWRDGDAASVLEALAEGSVEGFTLSNILDGASAGYRERLMRAVARASAAGAMLVLRTFGRSTGFPFCEDWSERDRSILWGEVTVATADHYLSVLG
ncbi:DUF3419 domain-containing protein [Bryocella elongata]|uniref:DUF3419 domain-containing protein n=1 Tax=Bryocella elongata TaxID=863522 RepID=UPI0011B07D73|nr:DUF3419 domain-containing protein [Bryocella elongata]